MVLAALFLNYPFFTAIPKYNNSQYIRLELNLILNGVEDSFFGCSGDIS